MARDRAPVRMTGAANDCKSIGKRRILLAMIDQPHCPDGVPVVSDVPSAAAAADGPRLNVRGASLHHLQHLSVSFPLGRFTVVTGLSGSGKSTLVFDTLAAEGRARQWELLSLGRRMSVEAGPRPPVDAIENLPPVIAIGAAEWERDRTATVGTVAEIWPLLQALYLRRGTVHCPQCGRPVARQSRTEILRELSQLPERTKLLVLGPLIRERTGTHAEVFASIAKAGYVRARVDGELVDVATPPPLAPRQRHTIEAVVDRLMIKPGLDSRLAESLEAALALGRGTCIISHETPAGWEDRLWSTQLACGPCGVSLPPLELRSLRWTSPLGACAACAGTGQSPTDRQQTCGECRGTRLAVVSRQLSIGDWTLERWCQSSLKEAAEQAAVWRSAWLAKAPPFDTPEGQAIAQRLLPELRQRLQALVDLGIGYLALERAADTLSLGEYQRARLAVAVGTETTGALFLLDEPTAGLHADDAVRLRSALQRLIAQGNTVIAVEHDLEVARRADEVVELGPGAGPRGGQLVAQGTPLALTTNPHSLTGRWFRRRSLDPSSIAPAETREPLEAAPAATAATTAIAATAATAATAASAISAGTGAPPTAASPESLPYRPEPSGWLHVGPWSRYHLNGLTGSIPLGQIVGVAGVSGSGKSTLLHELLVPRLRQRFRERVESTHDDTLRIESKTPPTGVLELTGRLPGRSAWAMTATLCGVWSELRRLFARTRLARQLGFGPERFGLRAAQGICVRCTGRGLIRPDAEPSAMFKEAAQPWSLPCPECHGKRFNRRTLSITWHGRSLADVLALSIAEAAEHFANLPRLSRPLQALLDLGLDYLPLGQPAAALSSGERQRLRIARLLAQTPLPSAPQPSPLLCVLDEPTLGLHVAEVELLVRALRALRDRGHSVLVIEHHLELLRECDWLIELGPGAGPDGGKIIATGTPADIARAETPTARALQAWERAASL